MKILKTANNKKLKLSKREWEVIGKKAGWIKVSADERDLKTLKQLMDSPMFLNAILSGSDEYSANIQEAVKSVISNWDALVRAKTLQQTQGIELEEGMPLSAKKRGKILITSQNQSTDDRGMIDLLIKKLEGLKNNIRPGQETLKDDINEFSNKIDSIIGSNSGQPSLLTPGAPVNVTMMEGGGIYKIDTVNSDGTVVVQDEMNRPMTVKQTRIYGLNEPKPKTDAMGNIKR
ncbi:MAG: hypothetical protein WC119_00990 [Synergistaceae bacterium]